MSCGDQNKYSMRLHEIHKKHFTIDSAVISLLEAYANPAQELKIDFTLLFDELDKKFYKAIIREIASGKPLAIVTFSLSANSDSVDIGNIEPVSSSGKIVHTSAGAQHNGLDLGIRAVSWLRTQIKDFARTEGFDILHISSSTRYTGARARNAQNTNMQDEPTTFSTKVRVRED